MSADTLVYDMSSQSEGAPSVFVRKDWLSILDNQNQNYTANQAVIDTSQLANSNKYVNYREAYLQVPLLLTLTSNGAAADAFAPNTAGTSADYTLGLKNWYGTIFHNIQVEYNGTTIIQQTPFINLISAFRLMTSLSWNDVITQGASIGFYPDNSTSFVHTTAAGGSVYGPQGTSNNSNFQAFVPVNGANNSYAVYNEGLLRRQMYVNYDPDGLTAPGQGAFSQAFTAAACQTVYKSYVMTKLNAVGGTSAGVFQQAIMATVYLKHIANFFERICLLKGVFMKITLGINNAQVNFTVGAAQVITVNSINCPLGGTMPLMIASAAASNGSAAALPAAATVSYNASISVGKTCVFNNQSSVAGVAAGTLGTSITLNVPAYTFNPVFEQSYLSNPVKKIAYTDYYYFPYTNVTAGATFNFLASNGIADIKSVCIIPFYNQASNGAIQPIQSLFDAAGGGTTSPMCLLGNFNVVISGQNAIYNTQRWTWEQWLNQLNGQNAVNGGMTDGICSSLISQLDFESSYCYYYVNVERMLPVEKSVPKSVAIIGQNLTAKALDFYVFIEYGASVDIDILTGSRI